MIENTLHIWIVSSRRLDVDQTTLIPLYQIWRKILSWGQKNKTIKATLEMVSPHCDITESTTTTTKGRSRKTWEKRKETGRENWERKKKVIADL